MKIQAPCPEPVIIFRVQTDTSYVAKGTLHSQFLRVYRSIKDQKSSCLSFLSKPIRFRVEVTAITPQFKTKDIGKTPGTGGRIAALEVCAERTNKQAVYLSEDAAPFLKLNVRSQRAVSRTAKMVPALIPFLERQTKETSNALMLLGLLCHQCICVFDVFC